MTIRALVILAVSLTVGFPAAGAVAVTDPDRVQVYHEFRAAFDAKQYKEALPLAQKLVSLTEEQSGGTDRALINPLSNLGTTQYRLRDFKAAEETFLRSIKIVEDSGGGADRALLRPLHGLGATYFAMGQYEDASLILKRALDLSRNLDGLFNFEQMSILDPLIDSLVALDRHDDAERAYDYAIRVAEAAYGKTDPHVLRPFNRAAHWHERMGRYATARILYARALQIAEQAGGSESLRTVEPLEGIARTYRLEFVNGGDSSGIPANIADPFAPAPELDLAGANAQRLNPDGERAILLALRAIDKAQPVDHMRRGVALVELGDWYVCGDVLPRGLQAYREAWKEFALGGSIAALAAPRQLSYRPPLAAVARAKGDHDNMDEHFVEVSFTVTRDGRTTDITTSETDATESQQKAVLSAIRKARYAPRLENGEPVDTEGVKYRERVLSKRPRAG
ncbi:MAG: tetratricopeptide repeat protein [Steroidobacteraceae bacterium]